MLKLNVKKYWLASSLILLVPLFFVDGPNLIFSPLQQYAWNLGHIAFFSLVTLACNTIRPFRRSQNILIYLIFILIISLIIETTQDLLNRSFSLLDILRNLTGCIITLTIIARQYLPTLIFYFGALFLILDIVGFIMTGWIDYKIQHRLPIIENFESKIILKRWTGNIEQSQQYVKKGQYSGKIAFNAGKYPGFSITPLSGSWSAYNTFEISIYNPEEEIQKLTVRLDDISHANSPEPQYHDRFNRNFEISPGWNQIKIPLLDIRFATMHREMELDKMFRLIIFMTDVKQPKVLYFDELILTN